MSSEHETKVRLVSRPLALERKQTGIRTMLRFELNCNELLRDRDHIQAFIVRLSANVVLTA